MMKNILYLINVSASSTTFLPEGQVLLPFTVSASQHCRNVKEWEKQEFLQYNLIQFIQIMLRNIQVPLFSFCKRL